MTATIDAAGGYHAAATCDGGTRYLTSADGETWRTTSIVPAIDVLELDPQVTIDGDRVHLAFSRLAPEEGGCGDPGLRDLGAFHQSRRLPAGEWSPPVRISAAGDRLESFRVADGIVHATVRTDDGAFYVSDAGATGIRIPIPDAVGTSLRVGDDGRARIAYTTGKELHLARVDGDRLTNRTLVTVAETNVRNPILVLGPGDRLLVAWTQTTASGGGCVDPEPGPLDGTYVGSDAGGTWTSERVTSSLGGASLTLDVTSGQVHLVVADGLMRDFTSNGDGSWTSSEVPGSRYLHSPVVRIHAATGTIGIVALGFDGVSFLEKE